MKTFRECSTLIRLRLDEQDGAEWDAGRIHRVWLPRRDDDAEVIRPIHALCWPKPDARLGTESDLHRVVRMHRRHRGRSTDDHAAAVPRHIVSDANDCRQKSSLSLADGYFGTC